MGNSITAKLTIITFATLNVHAGGLASDDMLSQMFTEADFENMVQLAEDNVFTDKWNEEDSDLSLAQLKNEAFAEEVNDAIEMTVEQKNKWLNILDNDNVVYESFKDKDDKMNIRQVKEEPHKTKHRRDKFDHPPSFMIKELQDDEVRDKWECKAKSLAEIAKHANQCWDYQPRIGILTQPTSESNKKAFDKDQYILEVNDNFIRWSGSIPIAIPYDIEPEELSKVLQQINGVLFTGGALTLIDQENADKWHQYYKTARQIFSYSLFMKDAKQKTFPVLGICQGLEVLSLIAGDDDAKVLGKFDIYGRNRPVEWTQKNVQKNSVLFSTFPPELQHKMETEPIGLHAHSFSVAMDTYKRKTGLRRFMKILQTDELDGKKFIDAAEAKHYPIFMFMYHPEYQMLDFVGPKRWPLAKDHQAAKEIAFRVSLMLNREARKNDNRIKQKNIEYFESMTINKAQSQPYPMIGDLIIYAYGWNKDQIKHVK